MKEFLYDLICVHLAFCVLWAVAVLGFLVIAPISRKDIKPLLVCFVVIVFFPLMPVVAGLLRCYKDVRPVFVDCIQKFKK